MVTTGLTSFLRNSPTNLQKIMTLCFPGHPPIRVNTALSHLSRMKFLLLVAQSQLADSSGKTYKDGLYLYAFYILSCKRQISSEKSSVVSSAEYFLR
jgi:hypothetical protein